MSQVRKQPLPAGRYWIDVVDAPGESKLDNFRKWIASNPKRVKLLTAETGVIVDPSVARNGGWFLFLILKPTRFDQAQFGFPSEAGPEIQHATDTVQRPPEPTPLSTFQDAMNALAQKLRDAGIMQVLIIGGLLYVATKTMRK